MVIENLRAPTHAEVVFIDRQNIEIVKVLPTAELLDQIGDYVRTRETDADKRIVYREISGND